MARPRSITEEHVLETARQVFSELGRAASTREIARRAGVSEGVLYQRYGSKESLFFASLHPPAPPLEVLFGTPPKNQARAHLLSLAERLTDYFARTLPAIHHLVSHPLMDEATLRQHHDGLPFVPVMMALKNRLEDMRKAKLVSIADTMAAAQCLLSIIISTAHLEHLHGGADGRKDRLRAALQVIWSGIQPE
jgi:AcrR family transcriptional regulator